MRNKKSFVKFKIIALSMLTLSGSTVSKAAPPAPIQNTCAGQAACPTGKCVFSAPLGYYIPNAISGNFYVVGIINFGSSADPLMWGSGVLTKYNLTNSDLLSTQPTNTIKNLPNYTANTQPISLTLDNPKSANYIAGTSIMTVVFPSDGIRKYRVFPRANNSYLIMGINDPTTVGSTNPIIAQCNIVQ